MPYVFVPDEQDVWLILQFPSPASSILEWIELRGRFTMIKDLRLAVRLKEGFRLVGDVIQLITTYGRVDW